MQETDEPASLARVGPQVGRIVVAALVLGLPALGHCSVAAERQLFPAGLSRPVDRDGRGRPARRRPRRPAPTLAG